MKKIVEVKSKSDYKAFIDFPHELYKNDPYYVPELFIAQKDLLTTHPFHKHSSLQCYLLFDGEKVIGRIAAILNNSHNSFNNANDGFFGFFDVINDQEAANILVDTAEKWLKDRKVDTLVGPASFSTNEACGLLIEGFDSSPVVMMTYNAPYYATLLENIGLKKKVDLLAWKFEGDKYDERSVRLMDKIQERLLRSDIIIRKINMKNFKQEAEKLREVYNGAWDKNMGFVPLNEEEFDYQAKDLKLIIDPDFVFIAEQEGKIVGFGVAIPDVNQIQKKIKRGRLLPTGIFKLLLGKKKITGLRIMMLGVIDGYRKMGIEACIYASIIKSYKAKGFTYAEASWTLEHNTMVNDAIKAIKGVPYKTYRIYEKPLKS